MKTVVLSRAVALGICALSLAVPSFAQSKMTAKKTSPAPALKSGKPKKAAPLKGRTGKTAGKPVIKAAPAASKAKVTVAPPKLTHAKTLSPAAPHKAAKP